MLKQITNLINLICKIIQGLARKHLASITSIASDNVGIGEGISDKSQSVKRFPIMRNGWKLLPKPVYGQTAVLNFTTNRKNLCSSLKALRYIVRRLFNANQTFGSGKLKFQDRKFGKPLTFLFNKVFAVTYRAFRLRNFDEMLLTFTRFDLVGLSASERFYIS